MKTVVTGIVLGIVFSITLIFFNRAFASDAPVSIIFQSRPVGDLAWQNR